MGTQSKPAAGKLKLFLGYAAGVGKTYKMLEEAQTLRRTGHDVVIGYFEPHNRAATLAKTEGLDIIPRRQITHEGTTYEELDTEAVLRRNPEICVVDELVHANARGSERRNRWEDVLHLLDRGVSVYTTLDIQSLEGLREQIEQISGVRIADTVPDWVVARADEVVMVDVTPRALLHRLERGVVFEGAAAERASHAMFRESTLVALRELALRQTAHEVEMRHIAPAEARSAAGAQITSERILAIVTDHPSTAMVIRRAKRVADMLRTDCLAVYVQEAGSPVVSDTAQKLLNLARQLQVDTRVITGKNLAETAVGFARAHRISQIFVTRANYRGWDRAGRHNFIHNVVHSARDMQVTIVADRHSRDQERTDLSDSRTA